MDLDKLSRLGKVTSKEIVALEIAATRRETLIYAAGVCEGIAQAEDTKDGALAARAIGDMLLELAGADGPQAELEAELERRDEHGKEESNAG